MSGPRRSPNLRKTTIVMRALFRLVLSIALLLGPAGTASAADSLSAALASAYQRNSALNAQRGTVRVTDESVPLAKSGWRPRVTGTAGLSTSSNTAVAGGVGQSRATFGIEISQTIFDGFQTRNSVQAAEARVRAERENLRNTEQNTLFDTAQAYMDVLTNRRIQSLRAQNLAFLREQLRAANARFEVGEGTRTDVAQARASLSAAQAQLTAAEAQTRSAEAVYQQLTGMVPGNLSMPKPLSRGIPHSFASAQDVAFTEHPAILLRDSLINAGIFDVKQAEGAFLPQVSLSASVERTIQDGSRYSVDESASIGAQVRVPIYQGGQASATVRQRKEQLGVARINRDVARDQVLAALTSAWTQLDAARAGVAANAETVEAQRLALNGVVEERDVGQRTTLDVLNAQADLINAQIQLANAQSTLVVASYGLASALGRLSAQRLGLQVAAYEPEEHYNAVKDAWYGLRTPDGR